MRTVVKRAVLAGIVALIGCSSSTITKAQSIRVNPGQDLTTVLKQVGNGTKIMLECGTYPIASETTNIISATGVSITGSGRDCTFLSLSTATGDVFTVTGDSFTMSDLTIQPAAGIRRKGGYVIRAQARKGLIYNVRLKDTYRGFANIDGPLPNIWTYRDITHTTTTGHSGAAVTVGGGNPVGDVSLMNWTSEGQSAIYDEPQLIIDDGMDTMKIINWDMGYSDIQPQFQPAISIRSSFGGRPHVARWIRFQNCGLEAEGADAFTISAGADIVWENGYVASSKVGMNISGGDGIVINDSIFINNKQEAIKISNSAARNISVTNSRFTENGIQANNSYDEIQVAAGTSFFRIGPGNQFGLDLARAAGVGSSNKSRWAVNVLAGGSNNYMIFGNHYNAASDFATGKVSDNGTGTNKYVDDDTNFALGRSLSINGDTPMSAAPRMMFSGFVQKTNAQGTFSAMPLDKAVTLIRLTMFCQTGASGQTTAAVLKEVGSGFTLTLVNGTSSWDSGPISQNISSGATMGFRVDTASSGGTPPSGCNATAQYKMQ